MSLSHLPALHIGAVSRPGPAQGSDGAVGGSEAGPPLSVEKLLVGGSGVSRRPVFVPQNESPGGSFTGGRCRAPAGHICLSHPYLASSRNLPNTSGTRQGHFFLLFLRISWNGMIGITSSTGRDGDGSRPYSSNTAVFLWLRGYWSCFVKFLLYKRCFLWMDLELGRKWHLQVLPRALTQIKNHPRFPPKKSLRTTPCSPGAISLEVRCSSRTRAQIKNSPQSHWCQCLHSCLHWKHLEKSTNWPRPGPHKFSSDIIVIYESAIPLAAEWSQSWKRAVWIFPERPPLCKARVSSTGGNDVASPHVPVPSRMMSPARSTAGFQLVDVPLQVHHDLISDWHRQIPYSEGEMWLAPSSFLSILTLSVKSFQPLCFPLEWPRMSRQKERKKKKTNSRSQRSIQFVQNAGGCEVTVGRRRTREHSICQRVFHQ